MGPSVLLGAPIHSNPTPRHLGTGGGLSPRPVKRCAPKRERGVTANGQGRRNTGPRPHKCPSGESYLGSHKQVYGLTPGVLETNRNLLRQQEGCKRGTLTESCRDCSKSDSAEQDTLKSTELCYPTITYNGLLQRATLQRLVIKEPRLRK